MPWSRPSSVPVGKVWYRFKGQDKNGQSGKMYQIRDMESTDRKRCLDMMEDTFLNDEPLCQILGACAHYAVELAEKQSGIVQQLSDSLVSDIKSDVESVTTIRNNWESYADQGICIACYTEENGAPQELVGFNILVVKTKDDLEEDIDNVAGEAWRKLLKTLVAAEKLVDVFEYYGVDKYLTSSGLTVLPEHRGQNIGAKIIAVREAICKSFGIKAAATVFTACSSQVLAAKCGYQQLAVLPYDNMLPQGIDLSGCDTPSAILMARTY